MALELPKNSSILDIGCGSGEDSVSLAKSGFKVTALDESKNAIHDTEQLAKIHNVKLNLINKKVSNYNTEEKFNLILCKNVLHFLTKNQALETINKIKSLTKPQGTNVISAFLESSKAEYPKYKFKKNELKEYYKSWTLLEYEESSEFVKLIAKNGPM